MRKTFFSISDLASEFGITTRSIRFYEEKGMLQPERSAGNQRLYAPKDRRRLKLILRGKRLGYSLDETTKMIGLADVDINEIDQIRSALVYGNKKLNEIRHRLHELRIIEQDLDSIRQRLIDRLDELEKGKM